MKFCVHSVLLLIETFFRNSLGGKVKAARGSLNRPNGEREDGGRDDRTNASRAALRPLRRSRIAHAQGQIKTATARRPHSLVASSPDFPKPDNTPVASQLLATLLRADPCQIIGIVGGTINAQTSDRRPDPAPPYRMSTHAGSEQPVVDRGVALNRLLPSPQPSLL